MAPSDVARSSLVCKMQKNPSQRVANDRPEPDANHLPIALLYHGFGRFADIANGISTDHILDNIDWRTFEEKVDEFMTSMDNYYIKEIFRNGEAVQRLNDIFGCFLEDRRPIAPGFIFEGRYSDGHALGPTNTVEVILEVKNELSGTSAEPTIELAAYYTQSLKKDPVRDDLSLFSFPALGIVLAGQYRRTIISPVTQSVIGPHISFYALAYKQRTRLVALTSLIPTTTESGNNWVKPALLNAFKAACGLRHYIHKDSKEFSTCKKEFLPIQRNLPYVNEVAAYPPGAGAGASISTIHFHIHKEAYQRQNTRNPNRSLYFATLDNPDNNKNKVVVIVKFTRKYCPELHSFCASQGRAPQLLGYSTIPGGWHVVVMERIEHRDMNLQSYAPKHIRKWSKDLESLVSGFHNEGWVHGDLRDANLIVSDENPTQVMLVDFDWGGKDGAVYYPTALLHEELEKPGRQGDLSITKEDDERVLAFTLNKLEQITGAL